MADLTKSEFIDIMVTTVSSVMKECNYSASEVAEAIYKSATKNSNTDKITRKQFDALDHTKIGLIVMFFTTDKDKSGFVNKAELKSYFKQFDEDNQLTENDYKELFDSIEKNGEVKLIMEEFFNFLLDD